MSMGIISREGIIIFSWYSNLKVKMCPFPLGYRLGLILKKLIGRNNLGIDRWKIKFLIFCLMIPCMDYFLLSIETFLRSWKLILQNSTSFKNSSLLHKNHFSFKVLWRKSKNSASILETSFTRKDRYHLKHNTAIVPISILKNNIKMPLQLELEKCPI